MAAAPLRLEVQHARAAARSAAVATPASPAPALRAASRVPPVPLDAFQLARIFHLEHLVGPERFGGWGVDEEGRHFVDVRKPGATAEDGSDGVVRHYGGSLHAAIGNALVANGGTR